MNNIYDLTVNAFPVVSREQYSLTPLIPLNPLNLLIGALLGFLWWFHLPTKKTKSIAILGRKATGKTTLWNQLRQIKVDKEYKATSSEYISSFDVEKDGKRVTIKDTKDIGGGQLWVEEYKSLLEEGTFIMFLVNAMDLNEESKQDIRARIQKILSIIFDNNWKECSLRIYITHAAEYYKQNPGKRGSDLIKETKHFLDLNTVRLPATIKKPKYEYEAVELTDKDDIEKIKGQIMNIWK